MAGRGRGEPSKMDVDMDVDQGRKRKRPMQSAAGPVPQMVGSASTSSSESGGDKTVRGRGGFRPAELKTIPSNITSVQAKIQPMEQEMYVLTNFVALTPMGSRQIIQYRIEFNPDIESVPLRRQLLNRMVAEKFERKYTFDGMYDLVSGVKLKESTITLTAPDPRNETNQIQLIVKHVGAVSSAFELIRTYNMNMKTFLRALGYFSVSQVGAYVHPSLSTQIGMNTGIAALRGYKTSANVHEKGQILMNLDSVQKIIQHKNVLQQMSDMRSDPRAGPNFKENIKSNLTGKLVVTNYNKIVYRIEDINFSLSPSSTFHDEKNNRDVSYLDYYQNRYSVRIVDRNQPLLLVVPNNTRRRGDEEQERRDIYLVPELCNIAGLTDQQRSDNRLKIDLIKASQIPPADRVAHMRKFLEQLHANQEVAQILNKWGYQYEKEPVKIKARILKTEQIGVGMAAHGPSEKWPKVDNMASFERSIMQDKLAAAPPKFKKMVILISRTDGPNEDQITNKLKTGFGKIGLRPDTVRIERIREGDGAHLFVQYLRNLENDVDVALVILPRQNKERYDAIKKLATVDRGLITQVVTARLMMDDRKASGAAVKIGVQIAAKVGGEPWYASIPLAGTMICGYDTYHDTANRGRSYGAFLASMSKRFSQWYSRVDSHDRLDELSSHLAENVSLAMRRFNEINKKWPERIFIYRDGVSDGQLAHVFNVELKQIETSINNTNDTTRLTFIVVNKRIGARFYMCNNNTFINPPPGSVIDDVVTRKERYDFYLVSQSTRNGTVTPTYYNILKDESGLDASKQQQLAFRLCFLYYNWTGTVRVPAPCQYAHKLALLCGEHLHNAPNSSLENNLHFL